MSAKIAVLGLVIEEPGPAHRLTAKLRQRLSSAGFVDSNVYSALSRLERDGLVRTIDDREYGQTHEGSDADDPFAVRDGVAARPRLTAVESLAGVSVPDRQAAEPRQIVAGRARPARRSAPGSRSDSRSFEATPAGVRHFEEWLLGSSTAPPLRDELHMKVALCQPHNLPRLVELVYGQELICLARVQELKQTFERMRPPAPNRWSGLVLVHIRDAELSFWEARLTWLHGVRKSLEGMHAEYELATGAAGLAAQAGGPARSGPAAPRPGLAPARPRLAACKPAGSAGARHSARRSTG
ncbi:MAG TPA: hypothetical protein VNV42_06645 [Solirubrobacteraceae bacterium]|jgi:hypothetical protein|nr:hypothetical protein [Solirubrobacteraceae bacterium]